MNQIDMPMDYSCMGCSAGTLSEIHATASANRRPQTAVPDFLVYAVKNIRITTDISWRVFHILSEPVRIRLHA